MIETAPRPVVVAAKVMGIRVRHARSQHYHCCKRGKWLAGGEHS
jgi:hypothetical protein